MRYIKEIHLAEDLACYFVVDIEPEDESIYYNPKKDALPINKETINHLPLCIFLNEEWL